VFDPAIHPHPQSNPESRRQPGSRDLVVEVARGSVGGDALLRASPRGMIGLQSRRSRRVYSSRSVVLATAGGWVCTGKPVSNHLAQTQLN
jgi:hypothetical protein